MNVLFVDDEEAVIRALNRQFSHNFYIAGAYSAADARVLLQGPCHFDVVVTDVTMPEMNGLDFIELVAPSNPETAFVVLTGNSDLPTHQRAESIPVVYRVLSKPASKQDIMDAIHGAAMARCNQQILQTP